MLFRILNQSSLSMGQKLTYILILAFCVLFSLSGHLFVKLKKSIGHKFLLVKEKMKKKGKSKKWNERSLVQDLVLS